MAEAIGMERHWQIQEAEVTTLVMGGGECYES